MAGAHLSFTIVDPAETIAAYNWHRGFVAANDHLFPRTWAHYQQLADNGSIVCAKDDAGDFMGLAYFSLDDTTTEWEVGGLMVPTSLRGNGVGGTLMRLTLGHVLFEETPLDRGEGIIAHVHASNNDPRALIEHGLKFNFRKKISVPGSVLPGLKTDANGMVHGDEFEIALPNSLDALATWCDGWNGQLKDGTLADLQFRPGIKLSTWAQAFRDMASRYP